MTMGTYQRLDVATGTPLILRKSTTLMVLAASTANAAILYLIGLASNWSQKRTPCIRESVVLEVAWKPAFEV